jgi:hypothetical protein
MDEPTVELLTDILGSVLQDSAFMFVEPSQEPAEWGDRVFSASLTFESERRGTLRLNMPAPVGVELAANMLGTEIDDPEAEENGRAAVSEVLNVIGGSFVTRYFGTRVPTQLGIPVAILASAPGTGHATCEALVTSETGLPIHLELDLE